MSRDSKKTDDAESPAEWVARHAHSSRGLRSIGQPQLQRTDERQIRRRSERETYMPNRNSQPAPNSRSGKPLVDQIDNAWRDHKQLPYHDDNDPIARLCDPDEEGSCPDVASRMAKSRRWRRLFVLLLILFGAFCYYWTYTVWPLLKYDFDLKVGFLKQAKGTIGLATGGDYEFAKEKIAQLDNALLPGGAEDQDGKRRLVFVGDIHGCKDELLKLLRKVGFDERGDHLIATGDVISKGPDSPGVIDELIRLKASSVRGNHEDRILSLAAVKVDKFGHPEQLSKAAQKASDLLQELKPRHLDFLRNLPLILRIAPLPLASGKKDTIRSEILVVHAGLVPAVPLNRQDPYFVMNMRSITRTSHVPSDMPASRKDNLLPWTDSWNWYHARLSKGRVFQGWHRVEQGLEVDDSLTWFEAALSIFTSHGHKHKGKPKAQLVIYGHDSVQGFKNKNWSKGLDTRCVHGGELTALVLDASGHETFHSVECENSAR